MINSINIYSPYSASFKGINSRNTTNSIKQGTNMIDELIKKMVEELRVKAKSVPDFGKFGVVWSEFENKDKAIDATHCLLKISPAKYEGAETERFLEVAAIKRGTQYGAESVIGYGSTKDVLDKLNERGIEQIIKEKFINLAKDLEDI